MPGVDSYPLTEPDRAEIDIALQQLQKAREILRRCKRANLPTEGPESDCQMLYDQLSAIKNEFFGIRP